MVMCTWKERRGWGKNDVGDEDKESGDNEAKRRTKDANTSDYT